MIYGIESRLFKVNTRVGINVKKALRISGFELIGQLGIAVAVDGRDSGDGSPRWRIFCYVHPVDGLGRQGNVIVLIQHFNKYLKKIRETKNKHEVEA